MKQLSARARAEEAIYANRCKTEFVLQARGLRRLGVWAASKLTPQEPETSEQYASALVKARLTGSDPLKCVLEDLRNAGITADEKTIARKLDKYLSEERKAA